uniref:Uncharacterized protein n=1 Tax=Pyricularia oryzae (strain P131) TaxID=1143193 RepID=L7IT82_PYRO1
MFLKTKLDQKGLGGLLQGQDCVRLPPEALVDGADAECDLAHQAGKGKLAHKQVGALLVTPDLAQSEGARAIASRLLLWDRVASCFVKRGIGGQICGALLGSQSDRSTADFDKGSLLVNQQSLPGTKAAKWFSRVKIYN